MRLLPVFALLVMTAACATERIDAVGASYAPPRPFGLQFIAPGPPPTAMFQRGLSLTRYPVAPPAVTEDAAAYAEALVAQGALEPGVRGLHIRTGTIPAGPCVKLDLDPRTRQGMVYVVPRAQGYLILRYLDSASDFSVNALRIEQSLARLRADP